MKEFWKSLSAEQKRQLAENLCTSTEYLRQVFLYKKRVGHEMAQKIERMVGIPRYELRPDIYPPEEYKKAS